MNWERLTTPNTPATHRTSEFFLKWALASDNLLLINLSFPIPERRESLLDYTLWCRSSTEFTIERLRSFCATQRS